MVTQTTRKVVKERSQIPSSETIDVNEKSELTNMLIPPHKGKQGDSSLRNINREINHHLP